MGPEFSQMNTSIDAQTSHLPDVDFKRSISAANSRASAPSETPSPFPRIAKPPYIPKRLFTPDAITSGLLAVRQEFLQAVASVRTAFELAKRAETAAVEQIKKHRQHARR